VGISKWNAGIIRPVPVAPAGPFDTGAAPGVWTLDQVAYWQKQGLWPIAGNTLNFIEDVFSTWLYKGTGGANTLTTNVNLSGKGGLLWVKNRATTTGNMFTDTVRGPTNQLVSNTTAAQTNYGSGLAFLTDGFSFSGSDSSFNTNNVSYASWTFREQPKFFDIVTYTGTGSNTTIPHNLGSVPGCIIIKRTDAIEDWNVYHRSLANTQYLNLGLTSGALTGATRWNSTTPTSTVFSLGTSTIVNASGGSYVAYLFAHDAGGFGLTGTDNVISCGSVVLDGSGNGNVTLGYEPQWVLAKQSSAASAWQLTDTMRGMPVSGNTRFLEANTANAEDVTTATTFPTATGFKVSGASFSAGATVIYIAIRRGPMRTPTLGTSVFSVDTTTADSAITSTLKQSDMGWFKDRTTVANWFVADRLRGFTNAYYTPTLYTNLTNAEATPTTGDTLTAFGPTTTGVTNGVLYAGGAGVAGNYPLLYSFKRAPGFFDEVCYTGTGAGQVVNHNLGVVPQLMIFKCRSTAPTNWVVNNAFGGVMYLEQTTAQASIDPWSFNGTAPTSTQFTTRSASNGNSNNLGSTYVAYLFATVAGVSKVGNYTGTGALQTVACGFTTGARFVLIKRTDAVGDWYVWDSTRGLSSGTDPYLLLNSTAAEVTGNNYVDTDTTGFKVTAAAPVALNASGGTYLFLAIA